MQETLTLPPKTQALIDAYLNFDFGNGRVLPCPYYINRKKRRVSVPSLVGKGTPEEIIEEVKVIAKAKRLDVNALNAQEIDQFMRQQGIGVDCSGFASNVLNIFLLETTGKSLFASLHIRGGLLKQIAYRLSPVKHISVAVLADERNSERVDSINDIRPGDLIVTKNGRHVLIVGNVILSLSKDHKGNNIEKTFYYQSEEDHEVGSGEIEIIDPKKPLANQRWLRSQDKIGDIELRRLTEWHK